MASNTIPRLNPFSALSNQEEKQRMREIQAICTKHSVPSGTPESLAQFMHALQVNKHLAMDFWSLIARLSGSEHATDTEWLLATVVEGITGQSPEEVRAAGPSQRVLVNKLAGMLAGQDEIPPAPRLVEPVPRTVAPDNTPREAKYPSASVMSTPDYGRVDRPRLVLKPESPMAEAMERSAQDRPTQTPLEPQQSDTGEPILHRRQPNSEPEIAIPLAAYAEENSTRSIAWGPISIVAIAILAIAAFLLLRYRDPEAWQRISSAARVQYDSALALFQHHNAPASPSLSPSSDSTDSQPAAASSAIPPSPPPQTAEQPPEPTAQQTEPAPQQPETTPAQRAARDTVAVEPSSASAGSDAAAQLEARPHEQAQISVPASQMRNYLISSRIPVYPQGARGTVVIEAIVTTRGTVEPVRVVSGQAELRDAAIAAVQSWHYRPYMLNGVPVDVSTTISVNDTGND